MNPCCIYLISHCKIDLGDVISKYIQLEHSNILMQRCPLVLKNHPRWWYPKIYHTWAWRPSCDIFLDIITSDDFLTPWDILAPKFSRILVVYTFISTSTSSRLIWKIYHPWASGPRVIYLISHSSINLPMWYNII